MVASLHRIEQHLTGICPDEALAPLTTRPLRDLLRIRRTPKQQSEQLASALSQLFKGKGK